MELSHVMNAPGRTVAEPAQLLLTVEQAARMIQVSRSGMFNMIRHGEIESLLIGARRRRIPVEVIRDYVARQLAGQPGELAAGASARDGRP